MKTLHFKKGQDIIREGTLSDCAYIIEAGRAEVSKSRPDGKGRQVIGILEENDIFGEMGLIDGLPRSATVTALEDCTISVLSQETFNSLANHNPESLMPILRVLAKRLRATLKIIEDMQKGKKTDPNLDEII